MLWLQTALSCWKVNCLKAFSLSPELFPVTTRKAGISTWFWSSEFWCTVKSCLCVHSLLLLIPSFLFHYLKCFWKLHFQCTVSSHLSSLLWHHGSVGNATLVWNVCRQDREKYICELLGSGVLSFTFGAYRCFLPFHLPNTYTFQHCLHPEGVSWQGIMLDVQPGWSCLGHLLSILVLWLSPSVCLYRF